MKTIKDENNLLATASNKCFAWAWAAGPTATTDAMATETANLVANVSSEPGKCCSLGCDVCCSLGCGNCCSLGCGKCCTRSFSWACCLPRWYCSYAYRWFWSCRGKWPGTGTDADATPPLLPPSSAEKTAIGDGLFVFVDYDIWNDHVYDGIPVWAEVPATPVEVAISFDGSVNLSVAGAGRGWDTAAAAATAVETLVEPGGPVPFALLMPVAKNRLWKLKWVARWHFVIPPPPDPCPPEPCADLKCAALDLRVCELETTVRTMQRAELRPEDVFTFAEEQRARVEL